jgi:hypothetical protein
MTCRYPHVDCLRVTGPLGIYPPVYIPARVAPVFVSTHIRQTNKLWVQKKKTVFAAGTQRFKSVFCSVDPVMLTQKY